MSDPGPIQNVYNVQNRTSPQQLEHVDHVEFGSDSNFPKCSKCLCPFKPEIKMSNPLLGGSQQFEHVEHVWGNTCPNMSNLLLTFLIPERLQHAQIVVPLEVLNILNVSMPGGGIHRVPLAVRVGKRSVDRVGGRTKVHVSSLGRAATAATRAVAQAAEVRRRLRAGSAHGQCDVRAAAQPWVALAICGGPRGFARERKS